MDEMLTDLTARTGCRGWKEESIGCEPIKEREAQHAPGRGDCKGRFPMKISNSHRQTPNPEIGLSGMSSATRRSIHWPRKGAKIAKIDPDGSDSFLRPLRLFAANLRLLWLLEDPGFPRIPVVAEEELRRAVVADQRGIFRLLELA